MQFYYGILNYLVGLITVTVVPDQGNVNWKILRQWEPQGEHFVFEAINHSIPARCAQHPDYYLVVPKLVQGSHFFFLDGKIRASVGDYLNRYGQGMNNSAQIPCYLIADGNELRWVAQATTLSVARLYVFPSVFKSKSFEVIFDRSAPAAVSGGILIIVMIGIFLFRNKALSARMRYSFLTSGVFASAHFALTVPDFYNIDLSPYVLHRTHDALLWISTILLWYSYRLQHIVSKTVQKWHAVMLSTAFFVVVTAATLDQAQVGSTIAAIANVFTCTLVLMKLLYALYVNRITSRRVFQTLSLGFFCVTGIADLLSYSGVWDTPPLYSLGFLGAFSFFALVINSDIEITYRERDYLRKNLEKEVATKTKQLQERTDSLEEAYHDLKLAKSESIQNAKLAALGTLSAGIAHEINNSLNYVYGSSDALRHIIGKDAITEKDRKNADKLLALIKDGLELTFDIIRNLKGFAAKGTGDAEVINLKSAIDSVMAILKGKLDRSIQVNIEVSDDINIFISKVGISQILLNLLTNAVDAIAEKKDRDPLEKIFVRGQATAEEVQLIVEDSGAGMSEETLQRVFEPFFTTKAEGKGTGLGLHIVHSEMQRANGKVTLSSVVGKGTKFCMHFPIAQTATQPDSNDQKSA